MVQALTAVINDDGQVMAAIWWGRPFQSVGALHKNELVKTGMGMWAQNLKRVTDVMGFAWWWCTDVWFLSER